MMSHDGCMLYTTVPYFKYFPRLQSFTNSSYARWNFREQCRAWLSPSKNLNDSTQSRVNPRTGLNEPFVPCTSPHLPVCNRLWLYTWLFGNTRLITRVTDSSGKACILLTIVHHRHGLLQVPYAFDGWPSASIKAHKTPHWSDLSRLAKHSHTNFLTWASQQAFRKSRGPRIQGHQRSHSLCIQSGVPSRTFSQVKSNKSY